MQSSVEAASIYLLEDEICFIPHWVFGGLSRSCLPVTRVSATEANAQVGATLRACLEQSSMAKEPYPEDQEEILRCLGVKSWRALMRGGASIEVRCSGGELVLTEMRTLENRREGELGRAGDGGVRFSLSESDAVIGAEIRRTLGIES
ncbi:MAG: hypothetical protein H6835_08465 [Planctomycetes bacterium]|nr:hypothetical protein [Planctomycetota bacterium]